MSTDTNHALIRVRIHNDASWHEVQLRRPNGVCTWEPIRAAIDHDDRLVIYSDGVAAQDAANRENDGAEGNGSCSVVLASTINAILAKLEREPVAYAIVDTLGGYRQLALTVAASPLRAREAASVPGCDLDGDRYAAVQVDTVLDT